MARVCWLRLRVDDLSYTMHSSDKLTYLSHDFVMTTATLTLSRVSLIILITMQLSLATHCTTKFNITPSFIDVCRKVYEAIDNHSAGIAVRMFRNRQRHNRSENDTIRHAVICQVFNIR